MFSSFFFSSVRGRRWILQASPQDFRKGLISGGDRNVFFLKLSLLLLRMLVLRMEFRASCILSKPCTSKLYSQFLGLFLNIHYSISSHTMPLGTQHSFRKCAKSPLACKLLALSSSPEQSTDGLDPRPLWLQILFPSCKALSTLLPIRCSQQFT